MSNPAGLEKLLRGYQSAAVESTRNKIRSGARKLAVVLPTGGGKTIVGAYLTIRTVQKGGHVLFLAHRREIIGQTVDKLIAAGMDPGEVGVIMAGDPRFKPNAHVHVASVDTMRNRPPPLADLVIIDECHRALANTYVEIMARYPRAVHIGLTATPWREDGRGLGRVYQDVVVVATVRELIDQGYLVQPKVFSHPERPDLSGVKTRGGDYDEQELAVAVDTKPLIGNIVAHWQRYGVGVRTVAFAVSVAHSKNITSAFVAAGVPAEHIDGTTPRDVRAAVLKRLSTGETRVVSNCGILTEGWDEPLAKCAILARPTKSKTLYLQCAGRILRTIPGTPEVTSAVILDHAGCALDHGLPDDPQDYSLSDPPPRRAGEARVKTCPECYLAVPSATRTCPECGYAFSVAAPEPIKEEDGELVEVKQTEAREKRALRRAIQAMAVAGDAARGWDYGEVNRILLQEYGVKREKMALPALRDVHAYLISGRFDAKYPRPVAAVSSPVDPAAWDWTV